ncbi:hypothetical protein N7516_010771 [Penicillium verrucosum]|uniref:uncharacterized protein n=1 Tax=Penicillium verrucosum TaxID=60171 RepID=UPI002544EAAB|nr:uncharacterized protein N7516_010771 [Penicillium verrucosum]KAJ5923068.1 hypothetical protein N7516_010771 [Penicillium verrucosum]
MGHPPEAHGKPNRPTEDGREVCQSTDKLQDPTTPHECQPLGSALLQSQISPGVPRRFLVQPIETLSRSSNIQQPALSGANQPALSKPGIHSKEPSEHRPIRRFRPEPIETSKTSNRRSHSTSEVHDRNSASTAPRRFKPDLIETATRSVRKGESVQLPQRHNAVGPSAPNTIVCPGTTSWLDPNPHVHTYLPSESQFSYSNILHRQQARRHSFRVPDLPSIPSDSSEESDTSRSHSVCTSPPRPSNNATRALHTNLPREIGNKEISEFLLSIAARSARIQLKEQALAAFPNEQVYEPVDHFAIDEGDGDSDDYHVSMKYHHIKSRRQSSADLSWELEYMRHHKEEAEMRIRAMGPSGQPKRSSEQNKNNKSPPMLGNDILIPRSASPEGTICEHSRTDVASRGVHDLCTGCGDMWYAAPPRDSGKGGGGLWMGTCYKDEGQEREVHGLLPGIVTPMPRVDDAGISMGLSPSPSHTHLDRLAASPGNHSSLKPASPNLQKAIDTEFHDGFVTQIYNYLSLGYPCLARYYDYELSRISGTSVEDLRRDDLQTDARGYVVAPGTDNLADACARWKALRLYIQEWARQEPGMAEEETNLDGWGLPERRGSWAI